MSPVPGSGEVVAAAATAAAAVAAAEPEPAEHQDAVRMTKSAAKKRRRAEMIAARKRSTRRDKKLRRKSARKALEACRQGGVDVGLPDGDPDVNRPSKRDLTKMCRQMLEDVAGLDRDEAVARGILRICFDLQFEAAMTDKELNHLSSQIRRAYGANRNAAFAAIRAGTIGTTDTTGTVDTVDTVAGSGPCQMTLVGLGESGRTWRTFCANSCGFQNYPVRKTDRCLTDAFPKEDIVYLSPDSPDVLRDLDPEKVYVIGGLVDDTVRKGATVQFALANGLRTARLPIPEMCQRAAAAADSRSSASKPGTFKTVLAVNQIFEILMEFHKSRDWAAAIRVGLPTRTGLCPSGLEKNKIND